LTHPRIPLDKGLLSFYINTYFANTCILTECSSSQPKLIGKELVDLKEVKLTNVEKYLFADDKKKVKVYVEIEGVGTFKEHIGCEFTKDTFDLVIKVTLVTSK